jgi:histidine triad (HIT) family protein
MPGELYTWVQLWYQLIAFTYVELAAMRILWSFTRSNLGQRMVGWVFQNMSAVLPVKRLYETPTLLAFYHPKPVYPVHILLVPKKVIESPLHLGQADQDFLADVFETVQVLVEKLALAEKGYRLVLNGGAYQDMAQLHFHLISGE